MQVKAEKEALEVRSASPTAHVREGSFQREDRVRRTMKSFTKKLDSFERAVENFKAQVFKMASGSEQKHGGRLAELETGFSDLRTELSSFKDQLAVDLEEEFRENAEENPVSLV